MNKLAQILLIIPEFRRKSLLNKQEANFLAENFIRFKEEADKTEQTSGSKRMPTRKESERIPFTLIVNEETPHSVITSLRAKNIVAGPKNELRLTEQGRRLFIAWVTRLPSSFEKNPELPDLERVLADSKKRKNTTFIKKASKEKTSRVPFNLRERRAVD